MNEDADDPRGPRFSVEGGTAELHEALREAR
jgi:hypothetical protein